jgi:hypothetical protein
MPDSQKSIVAISLGLFASLSIYVPSAVASECMPGWSEKLDRLRAAQRAHACGSAENFSDCEAMMGLGIAGAAVAGVAGAKGAGAASRAVSSIRDAQFRPCPVSFGGRTLSPGKLETAILLRLLGEEAWASCTSRMDIHKSQVREALRLVEAEVAAKVETSERALREMESAERRLASLPESERAAQGRALANSNLQSVQAEASKAQRAYESARNRLGYQQAFNDQMNFGDLKRSKEFELRKLFRQYFGKPMGDELWDFQAMADRLPPDQREKFLSVDRELKDAHMREYKARMQIDSIERDSSVSKLKSTAHAVDQQALRVRQLVSGGNYAAELAKERAALSSALSEAKRAKQTLDEMKAATEIAKSAGDLYQIASRVGQVIPKESLLDPAKKVLSATISEIGRLADTLGQIESKMTEGMASTVARFAPNLGRAAPAMRALGLATGRAVAFVGGSFVSLATFASNEGVGACTAMPTSDLFPATEANACDRFSLENSNVREIAEMDPDALCRLAKENPEVGMMIDQNYGRYFGGLRGQCGDPMRLASSNWGNLTYDGTRLVFTPGGESKPVVIEYDSNGNESGIRYPAALSSGSKQLEWGESAPWGYGSIHDKSMMTYKQRILPALAEAKACCSSESGVKPDPGDCAKWGLSNSSSRPSGGGGTTR